MSRLARPSSAGCLEYPALPRRPWLLTIVLASVLVVLCLFGQTIMTMVNVWISSRTFAHGLLVVPATGYLVWCYRDRLKGSVPAPCGWGLLFLLLISGSWLIARLTHTLLGEQVAVIAMFPGLVWALLGTAVLRSLLIPLGFLIFALPVGTSLEPLLQDITTALIMGGLNAAAIPSYRTGYLIALPGQVWQVAPDCGGLRYLLPGLALGYLYAAVVYRRWQRRLLFLLVCLVLLVAANGVRAYAIIVANYLGVAAGTDHRVFSYMIYGVTMLSLLRIGLKWQEHHPGETELPECRETSCRPTAFSDRHIALTALAAVALLALAPLSAWLLGVSH